ncbi:FG-GAP repeat domain-containing protein [Rubricoccus marinus]|uniref:FlgD/Vpr Ig-like domain-containing protein n=1 Tax=Rubricoccus marinus TaxID=716817 RepID=A0A259TWV2_9BACT|nr:VCBS repeat-containing protein [Rubricoccus marinus]OZC02201.1 hypothetical protein BSZ36_03885 [Rubricoccus marinus]
MRFVLPLLLLALTTGCSTAPPAMAQASFTPEALVRTATPFPVEGADGPLALPFTGGYWAPVPQLTDLNGDGRPDLTITTGGAGIDVYANTADGWVWQTGKLGGITPGPWYRFADIDADGDPDLLTRGAPGQARYFENTGTASSPQFTLRAEPLLLASGEIVQIEDTSVPDLSDVDGDGDFDLIVGKADLGTISFYEMVGLADGIPQFSLITTEWQGIQIYEGSPQCRDAYGSVYGITPEAGRATRHGANALALADITGSGGPELFWGDFFSENLFYFLNIGTPEAPAFDLVSESFPGTSTPGGQNAAAFGDTDGDGDLDLVVGVLGGLCVTSRTPTQNIVSFLNTGTPEDPAFEIQTTRLLRSIDHGRRSVPAFADIDGDGDLDMIVGDGNTDANLTLYTNTGTSGAPRFALTDPDWLALDYDFGGYAPTFGDLDADGDLDLLVGGFNGRLAFLENTGTATAPVYELRDERYAGIDAGQYAKPDLADIDGDGDLDLLVGESNGRVFLYRNAGTPEAASFATASNGTPGPADLAFRDDLGLTDDVGQESAPSAADLDGDGDLDILIGSSPGDIAVYLNVGSATAPAYQAAGEIDAERLTIVPRAADLTGDGLVDLVAGSDAGGLLYWANTFTTASVAPPSGLLRLDAYPNPSSGEVRLAFGRAVRGEVVVHDARGREVRRVVVSSADATWDGRDASGSDAPAGVYLLQFEGLASAQVTLAR